ncbi:MAG TPA: alpha/beta fold hydrolase [Hyphomicrobiaceae bacterium]|nr:alpha/beta fold hydrolase [Hyphomicrobiaceae bacterium]
MDLTVDGRKVYAATGGKPVDPAKPAVLMVHGAGLDHTTWQLPARWLAWHGHAVLAVDLPGHGRSEGPPLASVGEMVQWLGRAMDAAGIARAAIVGHSMGGAIALEAAAAMPERVTRIALLGTAARIPVNDALLKAARDTPQRAYEMITTWGHGAGARMGGNPVPGLWMTGGSLALMARNAPGVLHTDLAACNAWTSGAEAAPRVRCPALVLLAANDQMTPPRNGAELARLIPASRTVTLGDCGHMLVAEQPDTVLDALAGFFTTADA